MPAPSICTVTETLYRINSDGEQEIFPHCPVTVIKVIHNGSFFGTEQVQVYSDEDGLVTLELPQSSTVWLYAPASRLNAKGGVRLTIPASSTATLQGLVSQTTFPITGLVVKNEGVALTNLVGTLNFIGSGVNAVQVSPGVVDVTITGTGGGASAWGDLTGTLSDQADLQTALDAKAASIHVHAIADVTGLQAALDAKALASRAINTTAPLAGGGNLSADRTLSIAKATGSVDGYLAAADFAIFAAKQTALGFTPENLANKDQASGYAGLDGSGKINPSQLPAIAISSFLGSVASQATMLALTGQEGDWAIRSDSNTTWVIIGPDPTQLSSWQQLSTPTDLVSSVFGRTGAVTAQNNDYTWAQVNKATSSLADIATRSASDLSSGTLPDARFPATLPALSGANLTALNASNLASGSLADARLSANVPLLNALNIFTAKQTISPAANANALAVSGYSLTGANAQSLIDLAGTWNTSGTPTLIKINVTDTASNSSSLLFDLQKGGVSQFSVSKFGNVTAPGGMTAGGLTVNGGGGQITLETVNALHLGNVAASFLFVETSGLNQWHTHPNNLMFDTVGVVTIGDYGANNGNTTGIKISDAADNSVRINALGQVLIGDIESVANATKLIVDDVNQQVTINKALTVSGLLKLGSAPTTINDSAGKILSSALNVVGVAQGGTGNASLTAYVLLAGGTTGTGALQQVSGLGTSGQVLTSNGAGALPTWQAAAGGGSGATTALDNLASVAINTSLLSDTDNTDDLGTSAKRWKNLYLSGFIGDGSGNEILKVASVASALNEVTLTNAATGGNAVFSATGGDTNIGINFLSKGTGRFVFTPGAQGVFAIAVQDNVGNTTVTLGDNGFGGGGALALGSAPAIKLEQANGMFLGNGLGVIWSHDSGIFGNNDIALYRAGDGALKITNPAGGVGGILEFPQVTSGGTVGGNSARIYSKDVSGTAEMFVKDEAGNETQISPHDQNGEWVFYSVNEKTGRAIRVNMEALVIDYEQRTGKRFVERWQLPR